MTSPGSSRPPVPATLAPSPLPAAAPAAPVPAPERAASDAELVARLNATHDMAGFRSRGGPVVRAIEARRRRLVADRVLRALPGTVVDVGCEDGWIAEAYAFRADRTVLVDLDPAMLARAQARDLPRTTTCVGDATGPATCPDASAQVVVLSAVLEHLERPQQALAAWAPVLVRGGRFVVFVPADRPILCAKGVLAKTGLWRLVPGISLSPAPGHVRTFRRTDLVRLLRPFGVIEDLEFDPAVLGYAASVRVP